MILSALVRLQTTLAEFGAYRIGRFVRHIYQRFVLDGCFAAAGALSYTTLVSLVPLLAISLAVLSAFPIFDTLRTHALDFIFDTFVPRVGGTVDQYITGFIDMAGKTTAIGVIALAGTATLLLATIEDRLNAIWRVHAPRTWVTRVTIYWSVLTLGPLLTALAFSVSSSLREFGESLVPGDAGTPSFSAFTELAALVPWLVESFGLTLFYTLIPHCPVRWSAALIGAVAAATAVEICRWGFTIYLDHFNSYQAIYGALATIPIFLAWMYFTWCCILVGAEIAAAVPLWEHGEQFKSVVAGPDPLALALRVLDVLEAQAKSGGAIRLWKMARRVREPSATIAECLNRLSDAGFAAATRDGGYVLARDLGQATLLELRDAVETRPSPRSRKLEDRLQPVRLAEREALSIPIAVMLENQERHGVAAVVVQTASSMKPSV